MEWAALKAMIVSLLAWINLFTGYDVPPQQPEVVFVPQGQLELMGCIGPCPIQAWTPKRPSNRIYVVEGLDMENNVCARAILVHELVHQMQDHAGAFADLPSEVRHHHREMEALRVQKAYLAEHGRKLMYAGGGTVMKLTGPYC